MCRSPSQLTLGQSAGYTPSSPQGHSRTTNHWRSPSRLRANLERCMNPPCTFPEAEDLEKSHPGSHVENMQTLQRSRIAPC